MFKLLKALIGKFGCVEGLIINFRISASQVGSDAESSLYESGLTCEFTCDTTVEYFLDSDLLVTPPRSRTINVDRDTKIHFTRSTVEAIGEAVPEFAPGPYEVSIFRYINDGFRENIIPRDGDQNVKNFAVYIRHARVLDYQCYLALTNEGRAVADPDSDSLAWDSDS